MLHSESANARDRISPDDLILSQQEQGSEYRMMLLSLCALACVRSVMMACNALAASKDIPLRRFKSAFECRLDL
jgi:hypothetical protein